MLAALWCCCAAATAAAAPLRVESEIRVEAAAVAAARVEARERALSAVMEIALRRHVPATERQRRDGVLRAVFVGRPTAFLRRYAVVAEEQAGDIVRVAIEAEVDWAKFLGELRSRGFSVAVLPARPRVLLVALGGNETVAALRSVEEVLEGQGFRTRIFPGGAGTEADPAAISEWARGLGCHMAAAVAASPVETSLPPGQIGLPALPTGAGTATSVTVSARGWIIAARSGEIADELEAQDRGDGEDLPAALTYAAARAGRRLGHLLLAGLEQSGWVPGEAVHGVDIRVDDIADPALLEKIQEEIRAAPEVIRADLRSVAYRSATWRVEAFDSGLGWDAVLAGLRLPRGRLAWEGRGQPERDLDPPVVWVRWVER